MKQPSECEHEWVFEALEVGFQRYRCKQCREQKFERRESLKQREHRQGYQESQDEGCRCGQCDCDPCECEDWILR